MGESGREIIDWLIKAASKSEMSEGRWKGVDWLIERATKRNMGERGWKNDN